MFLVLAIAFSLYTPVWCGPCESHLEETRKKETPQIVHVQQPYEQRLNKARQQRQVQERKLKKNQVKAKLRKLWPYT